MKHNPYLIWNVFLGLIFAASVAQAARASSLVHAKAKAAAAAVTINSTVLEDEVSSSVAPTRDLAAGNETAITNATKLTGVPQIDYVFDPNLPRELNGLNLTEYPFFSTIPEEIDFKCDGLHDGFYASVIHKCQVYHHCLFGTRYDFLCANYTAFDQRTFICHFASEVDCKNSPKFFNRNEALYKSPTTTTIAPPTSSRSQSEGSRRRPPSRRRKPSYDYYDDYSDEYEEEDRREKRPKPQSKDPASSEYEEPLPTAPNKALYDKPRIAPKIRRPVPVNEREKYDYSGDSRVIPTKASSVEESFIDDDSKTDSGKRKNKPRTQEGSAESSKSKDRDRDRYRDRERDRAPSRSTDEERERTRERDRIRDDDRDRDFDRERPRSRRPGKKRKRPEPYDYYDDYEEESARRPRPRDRIRYTDEDDEEYDDRYYRKPTRSRGRERDRERDRYRPKDEEERRSKPSSRIRDYDEEDERYFPSTDSEDRTATKTRDKYEGSKGKGWRDSARYQDEEDGEESIIPRKQQKTSASPAKGSIEPVAKNNKEESRRSEVTSSEEKSEPDSKLTVDEEEAEGEMSTPEKIRNDNTGEGGRPRQNYFPRARTTTMKPILKPEAYLDEKPLPAPRPAYITPPQPKTTKKQPDATTRKPAGFRRPVTPRYSEEFDEEENKKEDLPDEITSDRTPTGIRGHFKRKDQRTEEPHPFTSKPSLESSKEDKESSAEKEMGPGSKLKVPYEKATEDEELAPRAPKIPAMSNKRRPFLPSRGGDPTLLRGLTPVGAKAFTAPKKEDDRKPQELPAPNSREKFSSGPATFDPNKYPTGIEFRTRVAANLGVEQPHLTPFVDDVSSQEEEYSGELTDSEETRKEQQMRNFDNQKSGTLKTQLGRQEPIQKNMRGSVIPTERSALPLRPTLRPTELPHLSLDDVHADIEEHTQIQSSGESKERKYSSRVPTFENNPTQNSQLQQKLPVYQQLGPQTFFSENPKFQTTVPLNTQPKPRPTPTNQNYNQGAHVPAFYQPVIKPGQGQVQVIHFQKTSPIEYSNMPSRNPVVKFPQPENLEDTDEFDVSLNDALTPLSSVHPRNAQTGVIGIQRTSGSNPARRRLAPAPPTQHSFLSPEEIGTNQRLGQRFAASFVQPQFAPAPSANPVLRNFHTSYYPSFSK